MIKKEQLDFLDWEFGVFFHFGIRTFNEDNKDWDLESMDVSTFNPTDLDCEEWIKTVSEAGAKYAILVCKHHDGFAIWPSAYTNYSVKNTPWKKGKGDVVFEFVNACRKYNVKVGLYYSPAQFGSNKMDKKEYDDYFINQISELLVNYGKIDYLWFDGCGSEGHEYDTKRIVAKIRELQPKILIFNMWDPDTRWIGNESGLAPMKNKSVVSALDFSVQTEKEEKLSEFKFLPGECDCRIRLEKWFYSDSDEDTVKSVDELMGLYMYSVGRGSNLLLNIGPDRRGLLPQKDKDVLLKFGKKIKETFANLVEVDSEQVDNVTTLKFDLQMVNMLVIKEEIDINEIENFEIKIYPYSYGKPITVYKGATIGHKAICQFPSVRTNKIEIVCDKNKKIKAYIKYVQ